MTNFRHPNLSEFAPALLKKEAVCLKNRQFGGVFGIRKHPNLSESYFSYARVRIRKSENAYMHSDSDADSDTGPVDVELGEWQVRVVPWVSYNQHGEGWLTVDVRRPKTDSGKFRFKLAHNGTRFARSKDLQAAPDWGLPIDDLSRYMRQVWGR